VGSRSKEFNWRAETQSKDKRISNSTNEAEEMNMLWTIFVVLLILWLLGFSLHVAGGLIHLLLVVALVVLVINLVSGRRVA
jgi:hypothetical protein